jgi:hypothetical protein
MSGTVNEDTGLDVSHPLYLRDKRINIAELCTGTCAVSSTLTGRMSPLTQIDRNTVQKKKK